MIKPVPVLLSIISLPLLQSCSNSRAVAYERKEALYFSREAAPSTCFVQYADGSIANYKSLKLVTSIYKSPHLLADGKTRIYPYEIVAYQNDKHYAISSNGFSYGGHKGNIATETLPGFAVRISTGRLNVYVKKYKENSKVMDEYYLQEGDGQILAYSPELMDALIKNNSEALDFYNNHKKHIKLTKELKLTAKIYNDTYYKKKPEEKQLLAKAEKRKQK